MRVINTTAFVLALVVALAYYFFSVHKWKAQNNKNVMPTEGGNTNTNDIPLAITIIDKATVEEEELVAIITAAIHEFTGKKDVEVVSIRPSATNWTLTGRQNALRNWL